MTDASLFFINSSLVNLQAHVDAIEIRIKSKYRRYVITRVDIKTITGLQVSHDDTSRVSPISSSIPDGVARDGELYGQVTNYRLCAFYRA